MTRNLGILGTLVLSLMVGEVSSWAQYSTDNSAVGGVLIDADGMLSQAQTGDLKALSQKRQETMQPLVSGLATSAEMRKISLKKLNETIQQSLAKGEAIPDSVRYLGGLTAVEYVFVYPEENDIVLVGPAEGWTVGPKGVIVGKDSGRPTMLLEDLQSAMRSAGGSERRVFSVSIDPTPEGLQAVNAFVSQVNRVRNPQAMASEMEKRLGNQVISIEGIERDSHFAAVLAAADYRMKQISMGVTKSPLKSLPSFVSMIKKPTEANVLPRWWMAPNYDAILRDEAGLAWNLVGGKVVTRTETDFFDGTQVVRGAGKASPVFAAWADKMTANYEKLSVAEPIFGQLRNCMDCAIVAAIVAENDILTKIDNPLEALLSEEASVKRSIVPQFVSSTAVVAKKGNGYLFTNGGVAIDLWSLVKEANVTDDWNVTAEKCQVTGKKWWKN
ncbi:MAG: DUF1598 domain-containing protein [Planctomycetia bacterium]|nr:DUF1598 domain-containing protein [Planctomycetia bacterium]